MSLKPKKRWWTASEIAMAKLTDLPTTRQGVESFAKSHNWRASVFARRRKGRGGGWEYSWRLFPLRARRGILEEGLGEFNLHTELRNKDTAWRQFDELPEHIKEKAKTRLKAVQYFYALERDGYTKFMAAEYTATEFGVSSRTIWNWLDMVKFRDRADWLAYLAPRNRAAIRLDKKAECDREFFETLKGDYLRLERPSFASSYRRAVRIADHNGWKALPERTARRRLNQTVPRVTQVFAREGYEGLARCFPPQTRDKTGMHAMDGVNADCHKIDVFVEWPNGEIGRPQIVGFQDIYSAKILSWRVDMTPNKVAVMQAFSDMLDFGIPNHCLFDNGREFANKWLTGGVPTRFRFKIREDDPLGVLPTLGIQVHWARPGHGQAKPIERAFRDLADDVAKDPRFAGAYVGNRPDAKPENYGSRAVPFEDFIQVLAEGIDEHNARAGRRSAVAGGRSFDEVFSESYQKSVIRKVTDEQKRMCLMAQEVMTLNRSHGLVKIHDNEYWSDWMNEHAGEKVIVRFDADDLHAGVHIYSLGGEYLGFGGIKVKSAFFSLTDAKDHARIMGQRKRAERQLKKTHITKTPAEIAAELEAAKGQRERVEAEAKVVRAEFGKPKRKVVEAPPYRPQYSEEDRAAQDALIADFAEERLARGRATPEATPEENFSRALELEELVQKGVEIAANDQKWLKGYQTTSEYRAYKMMHDDYKLGEVK